MSDIRGRRSRIALRSMRATLMKRLAMRHDQNRRHLLSALTLAPFACASGAAAAQQALPPLVQPAEPTRAAFFARARELRDQAVREGDQAYGAVVVRDGVIVGEGRNYVVLQSDPTAHSELLECVMPRAGSAPATSRNAMSIRPPRPARCARARSIGGASDASSPSMAPRRALRRSLGADDGVVRKRPLALSEELAVARLARIRVVFRPPGLLSLFPRRFCEL
jgi:hypothetical protein